MTDVEIADLLNRPSLALIIDVYKTCDPKHVDYYNSVIDNIRDFCKNNHNITAVAMAAYNGVDLTTIHREQPWYDNGRQLFYNEIRWETLRKIWSNHNHVDGNITHPGIVDMLLRPDQVQFSVFSDLQVAYYCNSINDSIRNIYVIGTMWGHCIQDRPAGVVQLDIMRRHKMFYNDITLLSHADCVATDFNAPLTAVDPPWQFLKNRVLIHDTT